MASVERDLSARELSVVKLAAQGKVDKEIAKDLKIQPRTVQTYWERLKEKLFAKTRTHAVTCAIANGLVDAERACERGACDKTTTG